MMNTKGQDESPKFSIGIVVRGVQFSLEHVTDTLGLVPSSTRSFGEKLTSSHSDKTGISSCTVWAHFVDAEEHDFANRFRMFARSLKSTAGDVMKIVGVEAAYMDLFVAKSIQDAVAHETKIDLDTDLIDDLQRSGLPMRITLAVVGA